MDPVAADPLAEVPELLDEPAEPPDDEPPEVPVEPEVPPELPVEPDDPAALPDDPEEPPALPVDPLPDPPADDPLVGLPVPADDPVSRVFASSASAWFNATSCCDCGSARSPPRSAPC